MELYIATIVEVIAITIIRVKARERDVAISCWYSQFMIIKFGFRVLEKATLIYFLLDFACFNHRFILFYLLFVIC